MEDKKAKNAPDATLSSTGKYTPTENQIAKWKEKHGEVFSYEADDYAAYLKRPDRKTIEAASVTGKDSPFRFAEIVLANCWLGGNEELRTEDKYFLGLSQRINELVEIKTGELKKL